MGLNGAGLVPGGGGGSGSGTVNDITSDDGSIVVTDPTGPASDLSAAAAINTALLTAEGLITSGRWFFDPRLYGAKCDAVKAFGGLVTSGSNVITAPANVNIGPADIGKPCSLVGAGATLASHSSTLAQNAFAPLIGFIGAGSSGQTINLVTTSGGSTPANASQTITSGTTGYSLYPSLGGPNAPSPVGQLTYGTDDHVAYESAIEAAAANAASVGYARVLIPGQSVVSSALYMQTASNTPAQGVSLGGNGGTAAGLFFIGTLGGNGIISEFGTGTTFFNADNLYTDFEIDGSGCADTTYNVTSNGFRLNYNVRCNWRNVYVHDTPATGFGCDYDVQCRFTSCTAANNGRLNNGTALGGAGFGFATGWQALEGCVLDNCTAVLNGRDGGFFEHDNAANTSIGAMVIGGMYAWNGQAGIGDAGSLGMVINGPHCFENKFGIHVYGGTVSGGTTQLGQGGVVSGAYCYGNSSHGFFYDTTNIGSTVPNYIGEYSIVGGYYFSNGVSGIRFDLGAAASKRYKITGATVADNFQVGIWFRYQTGTGLVTDIDLDSNTVLGNGISNTFEDNIRLDINATGVRIKGGAASEAVHGYGIDIGTSYQGTITNLTIDGVDLQSNNAGTIHIQAGVTFAGTFVIRNCPGYNPVGSTVPGTAFALAASTATWTNATGVDVTLYCSAVGNTTAISVDGVSIPIAAFVLGASFRVVAGGTFAATYSSAPTLTAVGD